MKQPIYHITSRDKKTVKGGSIQTVNITRIGSKPRVKGQMLTLADLRGRK